MKTTLVTASASVVIGVDNMKEHLRVDHDVDDDYITALTESALTCVENITNRKLLTSTWKAYADEWPSDHFTLPFGRLQSVTSVKYKDSDGVETTIDPSEYIVDIDSDPGRVVLGYGETWPSETLYPSNPIYIEYVCGYKTATGVPAPIKAAMMLMVGDAYANRESIVVGQGQTVQVIPNYIQNLLGSYRLGWFS